MSLSLIYITNVPEVALVAERNGVDRVMVDLETLGKEERQKNMNTVKSHHTVADIAAIADVLSVSELLVRVNPWNDTSRTEIESVISAGADSIMLPMWKTKEEVDNFLVAIGGRVKTILLLETKEAVNIVDDILNDPRVDEIHIGLNDLHLSYKLTFMFEPLSNGVVEELCLKFKEKGIKYGFGGIARIGEGTLPADNIVMEHYRLGSTMAFLSRSFCNADEIKDIEKIEAVFKTNMKTLRDFEDTLPLRSDEEYCENKIRVAEKIKEIVTIIQERR